MKFDPFFLFLFLLGVAFVGAMTLIILGADDEDVMRVDDRCYAISHKDNRVSGPDSSSRGLYCLETR